jgi:hypothetical protein
MNSKPPSIARLLHSLVVVGTTLSGCGGTAGDDGRRPTSDEPTGSRGPVAPPQAPAPSTALDAPSPARPETTPLQPSDCVATQQFQCDDWNERTGCQCDDAAPMTPADCDQPVQFVCEFSQENSDVLFGDSVGCRCDTSRPNLDLCELPQQYRCDGYTTHAWYECFCDDQAPLAREDCGPSQIFTCQSSDPIFGCECITGIR